MASSKGTTKEQRHAESETHRENEGERKRENVYVQQNTYVWTDVYSSSNSKNRNGNNDNNGNSDRFRVFVLFSLYTHSVFEHGHHALSLSPSLSQSLARSPSLTLYMIFICCGSCYYCCCNCPCVFCVLSVSATISVWLEFSIVQVTG